MMNTDYRQIFPLAQLVWPSAVVVAVRSSAAFLAAKAQGPYLGPYTVREVWCTLDRLQLSHRA